MAGPDYPPGTERRAGAPYREPDIGYDDDDHYEVPRGYENYERCLKSNGLKGAACRSVHCWAALQATALLVAATVPKALWLALASAASWELLSKKRATSASNITPIIRVRHWHMRALIPGIASDRAGRAVTIIIRRRPW